MGEADSGLARLGEGLKRPPPQPSHHPSTSFLPGGLWVHCSVTSLPGGLPLALTWTPVAFSHLSPSHSHLLQSPPQTNTRAGLTNPVFLPHPQLLWFHCQKRQLKSGPQPTSLSTGNNPELEEVRGETQKGKGREPVDWGGGGKDQAGLRH